jgi:hypothetical protein
MVTDGFILKVTLDTSLEKIFEYKQNEVRMGRSSAHNDLVLNDQSISSEHAIIVKRGNCYLLTDLQSTNGTSLNAVPLQGGREIELHDKDEIVLGTVSIKFSCDGVSNQRALDHSNQSDIEQTILGIVGNQAKNKKTSGRIPVRRKLLYVTATLVLSLLVFVIFYKLKVGGLSVATVSNREQKTIQLPTNDIYGFSQNINTNYDKAVFSFSGISGMAVLYYTAGLIDSDDEIAISLNGNQLGYVPMAMGSWGAEEKITLPKKFLIPDGENRVVFDSTVNPPAKNQWLVKNLSIEFFPDKACDNKQGERFFDLGEEMLKEKNVNDQNLYLATKYYLEALSFSANCSLSPDYYQVSRKHYDVASKELDEKYDSIIFSYNKSVRLGQNRIANQYLEKIINLIPDEKDRRVIKVKKLLNDPSQNNIR